MQISTRGRYAVRIMLDLAIHSAKGTVGRQEIALRQEISSDYIAQLFLGLAKAGLVQGFKGPGGGYRLARPTDKVSVGDILRAVEGPIAAVYCVDDEKQKTCRRVEHCTTRRLWVRLSKAIQDYLDGITLQELCDPSGQDTDRICPGLEDLAGSLLEVSDGNTAERNN